MALLASGPAPGYANLLPELLLALVGHPGDAFAAGTPPEDGALAPLQLSQRVDWVTPPQRDQLDRLCALGAYCAALEAYVQAASSTEGPPSPYRLALANGVSELLDVYRSAVLAVEQHLLRHPAPPLLSLQQFLSEFEALLPEVHAVVAEAGRRHLPGAGAMELLAARARSGAPAVQSCMQRLLWHCQQVLLKQLESWLLHGLLLDRSGEFFIQRQRPGGGDAGEGAAGLEPGPEDDAAAHADWRSSEWHAGFEVRADALPPGVSPAAAAAALFIGKAVRVLKAPVAGAASQQALHAAVEVLELAPALRALRGRQELEPTEVEAALEGMRRRVSALLWGLVRHRCDLVGHLEALKSYFMLGRGDFYQQLLDEAADLLAAAPRLASADADAALAFQQSATRSTAEADPLFAGFGLRWADAATEALPEGEGGPPAWHPSRAAGLHVPRLDGWDGLYLEAAVEWPLPLLLPAEVLQQYGAVWQYLFRLKRVQRALQSCWGDLRALRRREVVPRGGGAPRLPRALRGALWQQRQRMAHLVDSLVMYLQVDVIDACFATLRDHVAAAADFGEADAAHRRCVGSIARQAFLGVRQLAALVEGVLGLCVRLSRLVQALLACERTPDEAAAELRELAGAFRAKSNVLYGLLQAGRLQAGPAPALRQLLQRLDFNSFAERQALRAAGVEPEVAPAAP